MRNNWDNKGQMLSIGPSTLVTSVKITMTGIVAIVAAFIVLIAPSWKWMTG